MVLDAFVESFRLLSRIGVNVLLGTGLVLLSTVAGWALARDSGLPPVRMVAWWVRTVVHPLLRCRTWWRRALAILINNGSILTALLLVSWWPVVPLVAVAVLGLSLGVGLRVLAESSNELAMPTAETDPTVRRKIRWGIALNLLEPPAILLTVGLSLAHPSVPLETGAVWRTFAVLILPATALAAGGEALWLGACQQRNGSGGQEAPSQTAEADTFASVNHGSQTEVPDGGSDSADR